MSCELPEVYDCDTRKARKEHRCCECKGLIAANESYNYHHGIWNGRAESFKVCMNCDALRTKVDEHIDYDDEKTAFGDLSGSILESQDQDMINSFLNNAIQRKSKLPQWMLDKLTP